MQTRLMRIFPFEARNKDLWIQENGYNQTTVLLQCTTRLEYLLNQITRQTVKPSIVLEKPMSPKLKPQTQNTNRHKRIESKVLTLNHINEQTEPDPEVHSNRIVINRKVKLSLFGQSISTRSSAADRLMELNNKETDPMAYSQTSRKEVSVALQNRLPVVTARIVSETAEYSNQNNSESLFADTPHSSKRIIFVRSKSLLVDSNPNNTLEDNPIIPRKYSFDENNLFEESPDPEYSPNINYKKIDVKLHKINKK